MTISIAQIKNCLAGSNVFFKILYPTDLKEKYELASLKHIIPYGLYYVEKNYIENAVNIKESLIITDADPGLLPVGDKNAFLIIDNPQLWFYKLAQVVMPEKKKGIHPTAIIDPDAIVSEQCYIGPYSIVGKSVVEAYCQVDAHVVIGDGVIIKKNTVIEPNSYIGAHGVAWVWGADGNRVIQPQYGGVVIEEDCFIGSDVSIVRGSVNEHTTIGRGTLIAHGSKIGHGTQLAENCHLANNVSLAGNSKVGARSFLGAACVLSSHVSIAEDCIVGAGAVVTKSFPESHILLAGIPAKIINRISGKQKLNGVPQQR